MKLELKLLHEEAKLPTRAYPGSVGWDLYAFCLDHTGKANTIAIMTGQTRRVATGVQFGGFKTEDAPEGNIEYVAADAPYFAMICSRSGLAQKSLFVANAPGIIDPDYRGEIEVLLFNGAPTPQYIRHGDRIAQLVAAPVCKFWLAPTEHLAVATVRGEKGFGSSGR